jgi:hypothetical protein
MPGKLPALRNLDHRAAANEHFDRHVSEVQDATRQLTDVVDAVMVVAVDMMWPTILKASRMLGERTVEFEGWRLHGISTNVPYRTSFVLEPQFGGGGYAFDLKLGREMTAEASERLHSVEEAIRLRIKEETSDVAEQRKRIAKWLFNPTPAETMITDDPESYLPAEHSTKVKNIVCCAFNTDGRNPPGYGGSEDYSKSLDETIAEGFDSYLGAKIFERGPSWNMADPDFSTDRGVWDSSACIFVMRKLSDGLFAMGLSQDVWDRVEELGGLEYRYYCDDKRSLLKAIGAGAVIRDGGHVGEATFAAVHSFVGRSAAADISRRIQTIVELAAYLENGGHTSRDNRYDCNDGDDYGFVTADADGGRTLFLETQHNLYRIDLGAVDQDGCLESLALAILPEDGYVQPAPGPGDVGYLGHFIPDGHSGGYMGCDMFGLESGAIRGFADLTFSVESMHCCWEEEHGDEDEPTSP